MRTMLLGSTFVGMVDVVGVKVGMGLGSGVGVGVGVKVGGCEGGWVVWGCACIFMIHLNHVHRCIGRFV